MKRLFDGFAGGMALIMVIALVMLAAILLMTVSSALFAFVAPTIVFLSFIYSLKR